MYFLYSMMLATVLALLSPYLLLRGWRQNKYLHSLRQRLGRIPAHVRQHRRRRDRSASVVWVHAVSVGEVLAVEPLVAELRRRFPGRKVLVSTTTRTGQELARRRFGRDTVFYFPLDFAFACRRLLRAVQPALVVIAETEIWPRFLYEAHRAGARVVFVNGRLSDQSFSGYRRWRFLVRRALAPVDLFLMQSEEDARRLRALGVPADRVQVGGNLKFDLPAPARPDFLAALEQLADGRSVVVAGSTARDEEEKVLAAMETCCQAGGRRPLLVLAPRHPERFEEVARLLTERRVDFVRRSELSAANGPVQAVLLDSLGELAGAYAAATVAFVGGSLVPGGGQNPIEPAIWGKPVVFGPSMENFRDAARWLVDAGAAFQVQSSQGLGLLLATLLDDAEARQRAGSAARAVVERERGAVTRCAERIVALLAEESAQGEVV